MKTKILTFATAMFGCIYLQAQSTILLSPVKDASIGFHYGYPSDDTNYGNSIHYSGFSQPSATAELGENAGWGIMDFDWSAIPEGAVITSAHLNLYHFGSGFSTSLSTGHEGNNKCWLVRITENWEEYSVTWNTKPDLTPLHRVSLAKSTDANEDYLDIDVTQLVQDMIDNPEEGFGFCLKLKHEHPTIGLMFASTDFADESRWPVLIVTYTTDTKEAVPAMTVNDDLKFKIFPNPSVNMFHTELNLATAAEVSWQLQDITGKVYMTHSLGKLEKGVTMFDISFNRADLPAGMYLFILNADNRRQTVKVVVE